MTDVFRVSKRSAIMQNIKSKDSVPERHVRSLVHRMGYRFRLHGRDLPGTPDIVLPRHRKVIFMHSCFFHGHKGCRRATIPETRREFWRQKIEDNAKRDHSNSRKLKRLRWECFVIWQCEIRKGTEEQLRSRIRGFLEK
jgi:DNA mismatch endonuclease (patch repair protein)